MARAMIEEQSGGASAPAQGRAPPGGAPSDQPPDDTRPKAVRKLDERRERHLRRSRPYRVGVVIVGFLLVIAGVFLSGPGIPGPGFVVIIVGLGLLALEFTWAARLLERVAVYADGAKERAGRTSTTQKVLAGLAVALAIAGFVVAAILWDIPVLPV